jgi:hypothetical protein
MEMTSYLPGTPSWVDLGTPDPQAAADFYAGLFGWEVVDQGAEAGNYRMCSLRGHSVAGIGPAQQPGRPYWTTYISVADAEKTAAAVTEHGGSVLAGPMAVFDLGTMAVFADPEGAAFAVWQPAAHIGSGLANEPGSVVWNELTTRAPERATAFYSAVFGWEPVSEQLGDMPYVTWKQNGRTIGGLMVMGDGWPAEVPAHWMVYFEVADADAAAARITELGGTVSVPPTDIPPGRFAVANDPQGAVFSIMRSIPMG